MARYRKIEVRIWNDRKFRSLSDNAKLAFMMLLTHPDTNQLGFIRGRSVTMAYDLGWQPNAMSNAILELSKMGMVMVDEQAGLMFIVNFLKHNPPNGVNGAKSWSGLLDLLPECDLLDDALSSLKQVVNGFSDGIKNGIPDDIMNAINNAIPNAIEEPYRIQEQEQEQEYISSTVVNTPVEDSTPRAKKPSAGVKAQTFKLDVEELPDEWRQYCNAARPDLNPDKVFVNFKAYWTIGKGKGKLRSEKGWTQSWMTWCTKESERPTTSNMNLFASKGPKEPEQDFSLVDYGAAGAF